MALAAACVGCTAEPQFGAFRAPEADFAQYDTYAWGEPDVQPVTDPRFENNQIIASSLQAAVDRQLAARRLQKVTPAAADLLVHFHISVVDRMDIVEIDRRYANCAEQGCEPQTIYYEEGTLMFDLMEAGTNKLVWRGWIRGEITAGILDDQPALQAAINDAVTQVFTRYPAPG